MKKYLVLESHDSNNVQAVDYEFYTVEGVERDKEKEKNWWDGIEIYEVEEGQEFIICCKAVEWVTDDYNETKYKIKYKVVGDKAIPVEVYEFYTTRTCKEIDSFVFYLKDEV